ncbi:hypothetical protein [Pseudomonas sp. DSP3-2-2]|uniref:hypothetical protein n=1 Tax=unclassified Pseudomonas TaxID=196821 RepID=UPI003CEE4792
MFTTHREAEIGLELPGEASPATGQQVWRYIEQELMLPWIYLQIVRRNGREENASMLMLYHAHELRQLIDNQSARVWVEQAQFVTPPYMNGQSQWVMEPLKRVSLVEDPVDKARFPVFEVASGAIYSLRGETRLDLTPVEVLFSAEDDLRPH